MDINLYLILQKIIDKFESKKRLSKKLWFHYNPDPTHQVFYDDLKDISKVLKWPWSKKIINKLTNKKVERNLKTEDKLVVFKTLNGILLLNKTRGYVAKVLNNNYESNFIKIEKTAFKLLPKNVPKIIDSGKIENYNFVVYELLRNEKKYNWKNWESLSKKILKLLSKIYLSDKLQEIDAKKYVLNIRARLKKITKNEKYLIKEINEIQKLFNICVKKYIKNNIKTYKTFQHGDLVPNNLIILNKNIFLIDWANGGVHNYLYDLTMLNFYSPQKKVWKKFDKINFINNSNSEIFYGWTNNYIKIFKNLKNEKINNNQVKLSIVISLAEIAEKSFLRYQSLAEHEDGEKMLTNILSIYENILRSFA